MATTEVKISPEDMAQATKKNERIPEPGVVVIFGASGDLTKRKLLPALFHLEQAGLLPEQLRIVGVARRDLGDGFAKDMKSGILEFGGVKEGAEKLDDFMGKVSYHAMNFDDDGGYQKLKALLDKYDKEFGTKGNRLFYLAVAPEYFSDIIHRLGEQGMAHPEKGKVRVIIEKPFGHDLASARELNDGVNKVFHEDQTFRIDHYLARRRCRTSSSSVLPTASSSPSGIVTTSITYRSRRPKASASKAAAPSTRRPAPCAMCCRTT
jgi:glucose-6-phosphate 1-dehydrogenase